MNKLRQLLTVFLLAQLGGTAEVWADAGTTTVGTLEELQTALADNSVQTVIVSSLLTLPNGTDLDGRGKTIQVETPYLKEDGALAESPTSHGVFSIASGNKVALQNMKVMGGTTYSYGAIMNEGTLVMTDVTMTRSNRGLYNHGTAVLKNCNLVRNAADNGGGLYNSGRILMDGCSFTENRDVTSSLRGWGGGGAAENGGTMYLYNTTMSNNVSDECGSAINNYGAKLYVMNCAITGNIGIGGSYDTGAMRDGSGTLSVVNSIITDNKYSAGNGATIVNSDVKSGGNYANCILGKGSGGNQSDCKVLTEDEEGTVFTDYVTSGIYTGLSDKEYTEAFSRASLVKDGDHYTAPIASDGPAASMAAASYFDYTIGDDGTLTVKMYFKDADGTLHSLMAPSATATEDETYLASIQKTEKGGPIGSTDAGLVAATYYTVTRGTFTNGTMEGISLYGDSYRKGKSVTVTAAADEGFLFTGWKLNDDADVTVTANPYTFSLQEDTKLTPVFASVVTDEYGNTYSYDGTTVTMTAANLTDGTLTLPATVSGHTGYVIPDGIKSTVSNVVYPAAAYATFNNLLGSGVTYAPTVTLKASGWATIYSTQDFQLPEGLEAYIVTGCDTEQKCVNIEQADGIKAQTPMLLYKEGGGSVVLTTGTTILNTEPAGIFKGAGSPQVITATTAKQPYVLVDGTFRKAASGTLAPYLCYLELDTPAAGARSLSLQLGSSTGLSGVITTPEAGEWHTLGGQKLNGRPTGKGIYIHNGRKEIIR